MSLTVEVCCPLHKIEILLDNKHMTTNENDIDMTGNADNRSELRTQSGQGEWITHPDGTRVRLDGIDSDGAHGMTIIPVMPAKHVQFTISLPAAPTPDLAEQLAEARKDVVLAAGELLIPIPQPGTDMSRMLVANRILQRQLDAVTKQRDALVKALEIIASGGRDQFEWSQTKAESLARNAIAPFTINSDHSKVEKLLGMKIEIDDTLPPGTAIVKGGRGE